MVSGADRRLFWGTAVAVVVADLATKVLAESLLARHLPVSVIGDYVQLRLVYNQCAAFGLCLGAYSRWIFFGLAIAALFVLGSMVRATRPGDRVRFLALALVLRSEWPDDLRPALAESAGDANLLAQRNPLQYLGFFASDE